MHILKSWFFYSSSNQVFAELLSTLACLTTTEDWSMSQGRRSFHSLSEPQRTASSRSGRCLCLWVVVNFYDSSFRRTVSKHCDAFHSKYKPGNAFVVAKVEGKWSSVYEKLCESWLRTHLCSKWDYSLSAFFFCYLYCRNDCWLLHHSGRDLPFQKALLTLSKVLFPNWRLFIC